MEAEGHSTWNITDYRKLPRRLEGPAFEVGGHPWRLLFFPSGNNVEHASFYLEQGYGDKPPEGWYSCVQFVLVLWNPNDPTIYHYHTANHRFNQDESDWGFTRFAEIRKLFAPTWEGHKRPMVEDDAVNVTAYVRIYKDPTGVLWHNFNGYDSKKETGLVGLKNQGATCYLNSLLQSLYFTTAFRKAVYQIPTEQEADRTNSAWALQRLFYQLQTNDNAVPTAELTLSFGWESKHIFEQQDVQELSRILMEKMEERMKGTEAENALAKMFVGKMKTYISCINVDYESSKLEDFWDIQLNVSGNKDLDSSLRDYIQVETMDGENKYYAENFGLQDAKKGVIFESFPQVLHLQLKRFEYDINRDAMMKVNDRYEFPETFDASPYLAADADKSEPYIYQLYGVLVHSGDLNAGHYYAFLRPEKNGHFYKFDDDRVTRATLKEAMDDNFGGDYTNLANGAVGMRNPYTRTLSTKRSMSAYMLVYIRQSRLDSILQDVPEDVISPHIAEQLKVEREQEERRRKDREESHLYISVAVVTENQFRKYQGFDLTKWDLDSEEESAPTVYRTLRTSTIAELCAKIAEDNKVPADHVRLWVLVNRQNNTSRPDQPLLDSSATVETTWNNHASRDKQFRLWAEFANHIEEGKAVWPETQPHAGSNYSILVFLKYFDPATQTLMGVGHAYARKFAKVAELLPSIARLMGWSPDSMPALSLFEEIKHSMIEPMKPKMTFQQAEIQDGDIVCFQKTLTDDESKEYQQAGKFTNAKEFYDYLLNRIAVRLIPRPTTKSNSYEDFELKLNRRTLYDQFAAQVGQQIGAEPTHIRFMTVQYTTGKPKTIVKRTPALTLYQILNPQFSSYSLSQRNDALYYEVLEMSLTELETKKALKVTWAGENSCKEVSRPMEPCRASRLNGAQETYELLVPKNGTIQDLLAELKRKAELTDDVLAETCVYLTQNNKITKELGREYPVASVLEYCPLVVAHTPSTSDEAPAAAAEDVKAIGVFHFEKEVSKTHGVPFVFHVAPSETLQDIKPRIAKRTNLKGKPFENLKFAVVPKSIYQRPRYLNDGKWARAWLAVELLADALGRRRDCGGSGKRRDARAGSHQQDPDYVEQRRLHLHSMMLKAWGESTCTMASLDLHTEWETLAM